MQPLTIEKSTVGVKKEIRGAVTEGSAGGQILPFKAVGTSRALTPRPSGEFLHGVFAQAADDTDWSDVMHRVADAKHPDLPGVFRRIATTIPHTEETDMAFFYWAAAEEFVRHGMKYMLPEVAAGIRRLDENTYDPDAIVHLEDILLAEGFEAEAHCVAEYFLAPYRADDDLTPWAVPDHCNLIFELRVGQHFRAEPTVDKSPEQIATELRAGIEEEVHPDAANMAAAIICGIGPEPAWTRELFNLVTGDLRDDNTWGEYLRFSGALIYVVREAWRLDQDVAAGGYHGLMQLVRSGDGTTSGRKKKRQHQRLNLLDYLQPAQLEGRIAQSCPEIMGINPVRARLMLRACAVLTRFGVRHALVSAADAAEIEGELMFLHGKLAVPEAELPVDWDLHAPPHER